MDRAKTKPILAIINSKLHIFSEAYFDKKKRNFYIQKATSEPQIALSLSNVLIDDLSFLEPGKEVIVLESLQEFWNTLIEKNNIYKASDFILQAIKFYNINSIASLEVFIGFFNKEFIFFKIIDEDKVYLNPQSIVQKIQDNISEKKKINDLSREFLDNLVSGKKNTKKKFANQISQIRSYLSGTSDYQKSFISSIKETMSLVSDDEILDWGKKHNFFDQTFEPFYIKNKINNSFSYDQLDTRLAIKTDKIISAFTIDDESTYDYDDAITIQKVGNQHVLYVHITNFSDYFDYESVYDKEARDRVNTIYAPFCNFDLYSNNIVSQIALREGEIREVISVRFDISDYNVDRCEITNNFIKIKKNYSYKEFDKLLDTEVDYKFLNIFTENLYKTRIQKADFEFLNPEISISCDKRNMLFAKTTNTYASSRIVSELMILANKSISKYMLKNSIPSIYRSQGESRNLEIVNIHSNPDFSFYRNVTPVIISTNSQPHHGLGVDIYSQCTSPIRRYYDSIIMRQLSSFLKKQNILFSKNTMDQMLKDTLPLIEVSKIKSKNVHKFWALRLIKQEKINQLGGYIYSDLNDRYTIFFNEYNIFDAIAKEHCKRIYSQNDEIRITYKSIDTNTLTFQNLEEVL
ncbi:MAG: RNB domain-containing ribonuclease [Thermodesulfobacteriota bacterium]|nr:RNB domain-containing ribonuclease [Thermodesulfobacteriota bacterium]